MKDRRGFTLIELLVVIAIIAVLAAILFPVYAKVRDSAKATTCISNMEQIGKALKSYLTDNGQIFPANWDTSTGVAVKKNYVRLSYPDFVNNQPRRFDYGVNWVEALYKYVDPVPEPNQTSSMWRCPSARDRSLPSGVPGNPATEAGRAAVSYAINFFLTGESESGIGHPSNTLLLRELDRVTHALCRPAGELDNPSNPEGPDNRFMPYHAFMTIAEPTSTPGSTRPMGTTDPLRHGKGSHVLFADYHAKKFDCAATTADQNIGFYPRDAQYDETEQVWYNNITPGAIEFKTIRITP